MRSLNWLLAASAALSVCCALGSTSVQPTAAAPAADSASTVFVEPAFNRPGFPTANAEIPRYEKLLVQDATAGALLQFSVYRLSDLSLATDLVQEAKVGVHVQVLLDGSDLRFGCIDSSACPNPAIAELQTLNTINTSDPQTWLRDCDGYGPGHLSQLKAGGSGCIGQHLNHNKFLLVSAVGSGPDPAATKTDIVLQSSSNNVARQYLHAWNNSIEIDSPTVYTDYQSYFNHLVAASRSTAPSSSMWFTSRTGNTRGTTTLASHDIETWSFPRAPTDDPVAQVLGRVHTATHCRNNPGSEPGPGHTHIDAAVAAIDGRPVLMSQLVKLASAGCHVDLVYAEITNQDHATLSNAGVQLHELCAAAGPHDYNTSQYVHDKYLLVEGSDRTVGNNRRIVYTGSENWTNQSLTQSDNRIIRYVETAKDRPLSSSIWGAYELNFRHLQHLSETNHEPAHCANATN